MSDPNDIYSKPLKTKKLPLGTLYYLNPRRNPQKPGRELVVIYDKRFPLAKNFQANYSYFVKFLEKGNSAGNHYHKQKQEIFTAIQGRFIVKLEDIKTKKSFELTLDSEDYTALHIPPEISHKVTAAESNTTLLITATSPNSKEDEFPYKI